MRPTHVKPVGAFSDHSGALSCELAKVGGKNGGRDDAVARMKGLKGRGYGQGRNVKGPDGGGRGKKSMVVC